MTRQYVYEVNGVEFKGANAWDNARAYAEKVHAPMFRTADGIRECFTKRGMFIEVGIVNPEKVYTF